MDLVCTRRSLLALLSAAPLLAGGFWEKRRFPNWSDDDILRLLTDSPWAKTEHKEIDFNKYVPKGPVTWKELGIPGNPQAPTISGGSPVGGIGVPRNKDRVETNINVRWSSSLPVRQATLLHKYGRDGIDSEEARRELDKEEKFYVIDVSGIPSMVAYMGVAEMQNQVHQSARLFVGKKLTIKPESAFVKSVGAKLAVTVRFPKTEPITRKRGGVEFWMKSGPLEVLRSFKPKSMVYHGRLEL